MPLNRYTVTVQGNAPVRRTVEIIADNEETAEFFVEHLFEKREFFELDFNWTLPERVERVGILGDYTKVVTNAK